jgi:hypothetical protein
MYVDLDRRIAAGVEDLTGDDLGDGCGGHDVWKWKCLDFCRGGEGLAQPCNAVEWVKIFARRFFDEKSFIGDCRSS